MNVLSKIEEEVVIHEINEELKLYISNLTDREVIEAVQVSNGDSADIPDEIGSVRAVVLDVKFSTLCQ